MDEDQAWMQRALELAAAGWGRVHPNPMVGAVVVQDGLSVGEGWHAEYGGPHAEVMALAQAAGRARGATLYVTLEPCNHHGRTPPCTDAIIAAGIERVVFASRDPNPVARGGAQRLADVGIRAESGILAETERRLNAMFHYRHTGRPPWVALKLAMSIDGRLAEQEGRPTTVTGAEALAEVHRLRAGHDAILVGSGTALADDPALTARGDTIPRIPPIRVVIDSAARLPAEAKMLHDGNGPVWIIAADDPPADRVRSLTDAGARILMVPAGPGGVDPDAALDTLGREGVRSVLCEGGGRMGASLIESDRVSRVYLFVAPRFFGSQGPPAFPLRDASGSWTLVETRRVGDDALLMIDRNMQE